jgi:hypothetical protein
MSDASFEPETDGERRRLDRGLSALSNVHRRQLLRALSNRGPRRVSAADGGSPDEVQSGRAVRIAMHHNHLPKLADAEFIEWDEERGRVAKGPAFDVVEDLLVRLDGDDDSD